ncbi:HAD family hydrolase [Microbacterium tumbae]
MIPTIVFDFDGTVAVGDGPVLAYARFAAEAAADDYLARVETELDAYGRGASEYRDGYDIVGSLARADGVTAPLLDAAYRHSRERLGTADAPVQMASGLAELLAELDPRARLVLATNAPETGIRELLSTWGIAERFSAVHFTVGKPAGLEPILREALGGGPVLAVGDIFDFDLAPAQSLGAHTALVGATAGTSAAAPTLRADTLADLVPGIQRWAQDALSLSAPSLSTTRIER